MVLNRGFLIAIEGIDGSGKSLLAQSLYAQCVAHEVPTVLTRESGGTPLGNDIRGLIYTHQKLRLSSRAEFLLYAADRAQHFSTLIIPALHEKKLIISDRLSDSSLAYQGFGRGLDLAMIDAINKWVMKGIKPDLVFYIDVPVQVAMERFKRRNAVLDSFEHEQQSFFDKVKRGFDTIFKDRSDVMILDGTQMPESIAKQAFNRVQALIKS